MQFTCNCEVPSRHLVARGSVGADLCYAIRRSIHNLEAFGIACS
jgi:hypothetical protein